MGCDKLKVNNVNSEATVAVSNYREGLSNYIRELIVHRQQSITVYPLLLIYSILIYEQLESCSSRADFEPGTSFVTRLEASRLGEHSNRSRDFTAEARHSAKTYSRLVVQPHISMVS